jgi:hypothetical protein
MTREEVEEREMTSKAKTIAFLVIVGALGLVLGLWFEWPELRADRDEDESAAPAAAAVAMPETAASLQPAGTQIKYDFDTDSPGQPPAKFHSGLTGRGKPGNWVVQAEPTAPSNPNVLAQTADDKTDYRFPVAIADEASFRDLDLSVKYKAISGNVDRAGGLVFRFKDANNYYVLRANALEDNFNLYRVVDGRRTEIEGSRAKVTSSEWHELRVEAVGNKITCYYDGNKKIEASDNTFKDAGKIGLWTKADSVTYFDDLKVTAK